MCSYVKIFFMKNIIYFDNAATSFPKPPSFFKAQKEFYKNIGGNPGRSGHRLSILAGERVEEARERMANLINAPDPMRIAFTYNASHALNQAILGIIEPGNRVLSSPLEHNSVARPLRNLESSKHIELDFLNCDKDTGELRLDELEEKLSAQQIKMVAVVHGSNVSGTVQPLEKIGKLTRKYGAYLLVDAAQTAGTYPIDVRKTNIDLLAFTGHKGLFGPMGTGGLYVNPEIRLKPVFMGGTGSNSEKDTQPDIMPDVLEVGTPNAGGFAILSETLKFIEDKGIEDIHRYEKELANKLIEGLSEIKSIRIVAPEAKERLAVISFTIENKSVDEAEYILDKEYGIMSRVGLHCSPWAHRTFGTFPEGTIRFSLSLFNTRREVISALDAVKNIATS